MWQKNILSYMIIDFILHENALKGLTGDYSLTIHRQSIGSFIFISIFGVKFVKFGVKLVV